MSLLSWRNAERGDRAALQQFDCTVPEGPWRGTRVSRHPKPWELDVQTGIHGCRPPVGPDEILLLGEDETGIAAVSWSWHDYDEDDEPPSVWKVLAVAVARRHRGTGGHIADEALQVTLEAFKQHGREHGTSEFGVVGWIHPRNLPSQKLSGRAGFTRLRAISADLEEWGMTVDLR